MSKNYILEPVELTFVNGLYRPDSIVFPPERILAIPQNAIAQINDALLKVNSIVNDESSVPPETECYFTPNGASDGYDDAPKYLRVSYTPSYTNPISGTTMPENNKYEIFVDGVSPSGVYTISIYTETEDAPDADPGAGLVKNVVYNDHPYNNWETILSRKGDPKTGYNTIEKLANATDTNE